MLNSIKNSFWYSRNISFLFIVAVLFVGAGNLNIGFMLYLSFCFSKMFIKSSIATMNYNQSRKSFILFTTCYPIVLSISITLLIKLYSLFLPTSIRLFKLNLSLDFSGLTVLALAIVVTVTGILAFNGLRPKAMILTVFLAFSWGLLIVLLVSKFELRNEWLIAITFAAWYLTQLLVFVYYAFQPTNYDTMIKDVQQYGNH
ncbi:hypothetical protein [Holzapfeliella sp. JNUCC 72]